MLITHPGFRCRGHDILILGRYRQTTVSRGHSRSRIKARREVRRHASYRGLPDRAREARSTESHVPRTHRRAIAKGIGTSGCGVTRTRAACGTPRYGTVPSRKLQVRRMLQTHTPDLRRDFVTWHDGQVPVTLATISTMIFATRSLWCLCDAVTCMATR